MSEIDHQPFTDYLHTVERALAAGHASEGSHYPALQGLLQSLDGSLTATCLPSRIECGAPDFIITKGLATVGYVEAKDIGKSLDEVERSEQLERYLRSLPNLILTDYLEFRWYVDGERRLSARLGTATKEGKVKRDRDGIEDVAELLTGFLSRQAEVLGTPKELALRMARLAHMIRNLIVSAFETETEDGSLHAQLAAFRDNLIPDLSVEYFADMYAQTIAYGLFAARCTAPDNKGFTRQNAAYLLPKTNPFLRKLFNHIAGPELDDRIAWLVDDLAQVLAQADMEAVLKDFGKRTGKEDPVVHFYETFLKAYDPKVRETRGVYYTPQPVVSYIVHSIDYLLKARFDKPAGLVDPDVLFLDPAVGTATFLYMVINEIHQALVSQGQAGLWNDYVAGKLLPRLFGFELLMAPYAIAHLKLGLLLKATNYEFKSDQRLGIYLTNTLEETIKRSETLFATWITEEANAAAEIKKDRPIMVVLGNPPYSVSSVNKGKHIESLMERYKTAVRKERNIQPLSDDYIKFIRFAHDRIEHTGYGIVAMITNNTYLSGLIHRGIREELMKSFSEIYILNLHGSALLGDKTPDGGKDENVFDIRQGVAIALFVRKPDFNGLCSVQGADVWGSRQEKYGYLAENDASTTVWQELHPVSPRYSFVPASDDLRGEYDTGWSIGDIFICSKNGIQTGQDDFVVDFEKHNLEERIGRFFDSQVSNDSMREQYGLRDKAGWVFASERSRALSEGMHSDLFRPYFYRPFDSRWIYYSKRVIKRPVSEVMKHLLSDNKALVTCRQQARAGFSHVFVTKYIGDGNAISLNSREWNTYEPLYLYNIHQDANGTLFAAGETEREPNLKPAFIAAMSQKLALEFVADGGGNLEVTFGPDDVLNYAYAIFHSPTYRTRYAEFLKTDFPRLPLTSDKELFKAVAGKGSTLLSLHLMESLSLNKLITRYPVSGSNMVEKVSYDENTRRVYINKTQYFEGVNSEVWSFKVGGYQVCQKWLKDRKGRMLTIDEAEHYQKITVALNETIRLMGEIDELIPGWPVG